MSVRTFPDAERAGVGAFPDAERAGLSECPLGGAAISFPYPMVGRKMKKLQNKKKGYLYLYKLLGRQQGRVLKKKNTKIIMEEKRRKSQKQVPFSPNKSFWLQIPENEMAIFFLKREGSDFIKKLYKRGQRTPFIVFLTSF